MRILIGLALAAACWAGGGGFWLTVHSASSALGRETPDAAVLVSAEGCGRPADVKLTGMAEGMVKGERRIVPLEIARTRQAGVWAVKKSGLGEGRWTLAITAGLAGFRTSTEVEWDSDGRYKVVRAARR